MKPIFRWGQDQLTASSALALARGRMQGRFTPEVRQKVQASRSAVEEIVDRGKVVYGVNTGFGSLCNKIISAENTRKLQDNILRSHSVGVGPDVPLEVVRLMLILKIQSLAQGFSGISFEVLERLHWHLEADVIPPGTPAGFAGRLRRSGPPGASVPAADRPGPGMAGG
ncbi:aromatic amino acid lyase [Cesiribacter andamanensis]|uniref:Tyrosine ammonia-lyase n=1 Tax=Cesiribacter andamanensis AMV16 TaxID=1279009 RepID=M7NID9_9BACT|nr:aromatic amino acid lyase [Cesiribacter andamanensis]EMR01565.1 Tyrosine ammonia-lyase [Cesiribacter andamanensis AMV16]